MAPPFGGKMGRVNVLTIAVVSTIISNMDEKYIHEQHAVHHILYHIIFCPKRRKKVLIGSVHDRLKQIIEDVATEKSWQVIEVAIQPDHVHLFIQSNPYTLPMDIARLIKGRSSHNLREEFAHLMRMPSLWTRSTFYSTAGFVSQDTIQAYIERQSKV
jgi:putative transposase